MKKVLILGANGYIGRHIAYYLNQLDVDFTPSGSSPSSIDGYQNYIQADVTDINTLKEIDFDVDYVFMFAGLTGTKNDAESKKRYTIANEQGLKNVLECCKKSKPHIVFPSSRLVYKGQKDVFLRENSEKEAKTVYARNKINCEQILKDYQQEFDINHTIFRICVPYGNLIDNNYSYGTLGFFLSKASNKENITLYGTGEQKRTFTHVADIVEIILKTLTFPNAENNIYNIGSNDAKSLSEVANLVANKFGVDVEHIDWPEEALKIESGDTIFNDASIIDLTDYKYQHTLKNWIAELEL